MNRNHTRPNPLFPTVCLLTQPLLGLAAGVAPESFSTNAQGVELKWEQAHITLAPATTEAFRLSVSYSGNPTHSRSTFLADPSGTNLVPWELVRDGTRVGVSSRAGQLLVDPRTGCWTLQNRSGQVVIPEGSPGKLARGLGGPRLNITLGLDTNQPFGVYGCGNGNPALLQAQAQTHVANGVAVIPYYWSPAGYAVLAVSENDNLPAAWSVAPDGRSVTWAVPGIKADLYLIPAATLREAAQAYARLTGRAPVPPRWTFGYLQSRWGWKDRAYIEETLQQFRQRQIPVDAFIYDFEWYTTQPDYEVPAKGIPGFSDFGWNPHLFPEPARQLESYKEAGVRFVGIRKPRLGNAATLKMIRRQGWDLQGKGTTRTEKYQSRDVDFANPQFRDWYVQQSTNLLAQGIDGWWNDEGEGAFSTYYYWNLAEAQAWAAQRSNQRLWTLNRAFSPGLQRLGAAAWTGDIRSTWSALRETPTSLLNWSLAGMPYSACDIGGFDGEGDPSPELLTRWMQAGVFFPIMRAHSTLARTPHFPWLFGPRAEAAMRAAIELRYRLIPFYYSLAHETFETGLPLMRPLVMEFPADPKVANLSDEWLMGSSLLAAPILRAGGKRTVYLPGGSWYRFGTNGALEGDRFFNVTAGWKDIPLYVKAGAILPLGPVVQHTGQLPGGSLELQVYPGQDASFTLVEDDGETTGYLNGQVRRTTFKWDEAAGRLSWKTEGPYAGKDVFQHLRVVLFDRQGIQYVERPFTAMGEVSRRK